MFNFLKSALKINGVIDRTNKNFTEVRIDLPPNVETQKIVPDWTNKEVSPFPLQPLPGIKNPILTAADVTDVDASIVADPFLFVEDDIWYMFLRFGWSSLIEEQSL